VPTTVDAEGVELHWAERGDPEGRPLVLVHGLLFSSRMFERLARRLEHRRLLLVDLRGHGRSHKPDDPSAYTWRSLADDVVSVLDAVGLDRAVVGGTSLGADTALATAAHHADRVAGLLVEMPVLSDSEPFARRVFGPASALLRVAAPVLSPCTRAIGHLPVPRRPPELAMLRDMLSADPAVASALLRGLLDSERPDVTVIGTRPLPALVIGHARDPLHALADAHHVAEVLPSAELHEAPSFLHYRIAVGQLASVVDGWLLRHDL
jgi:pimeloyl-ACP methyl ester carboxylesterase